GREAARELARAPANRRVVARAVPDDRGRGEDALGGAHSLRAGPAPGRGDRGVAPGRPPVLSGCPASGAGGGARDGEAVPRGWPVAWPSRTGGVSRRGAHTR